MFRKSHRFLFMKVSCLLALVGLFQLSAATGFAAAIANFDGGADSPYNLEQRGAGQGPTFETADGNPGGFLQLTANVNDSHNFVSFDRTDVGTFPLSTFRFDFRVDNLGAGGADGFSFGYIPTEFYGTTGPVGTPIFGPAEDASAFAALGFGFDTWGNGAPADTNGNGANYSEIALVYDGVRIARIDDTRDPLFLATPFDIKDGAWHTVTGVVEFEAKRVSLNVDGNPIFANVSVPDLVPFESRIAFGARTGNANERVAIDNINVSYVVPEPVTGWLLVAGGLLIRRWRVS